MITGKTSLELSAIAQAGGSLEVDARGYTSLELSAIATALSQNAYLKIHNSSSKTSMELSAIANAKRGQVIFC